MAVIIEFSVPSDCFKFGEILSLKPGVRVKVEQMVPMGDTIMPFSWVTDDTESFEEGLEKNGIPHTVVLEDDENERKLYRLEWSADDDDLIQAILASKGSVLNASGNPDEWNFSVRFSERVDLSKFHRRCRSDDLAIGIDRIYNPIEVSGNSRDSMTLTQTQTLIEALDAGYYDIPRDASLINLAEKYGISDQAVSERLRRATAELIKSSLVRSEEGIYVGEVTDD